MLLAWLVLMLLYTAQSFAVNIKVGMVAPDFAVPTLDGQRTVRLGDFRGHRVLIFTWASW